MESMYIIILQQERVTMTDKPMMLNYYNKSVELEHVPGRQISTLTLVTSPPVLEESTKASSDRSFSFCVSSGL